MLNRGQQVKQVMGEGWGARGHLVFLREEDLAMFSRDGRGQPIIFWLVLFTLCEAFLFSVVGPVYQTPREQESTALR